MSRGWASPDARPPRPPGPCRQPQPARRPPPRPPRPPQRRPRRTTRTPTATRGAGRRVSSMSEFEGAPEVPARDGPEWAPPFAARGDLPRRRYLLRAERELGAPTQAEVVDGEDVGPAEVEDQEHLRAPSPDAAHGGERVDALVVAETPHLRERRQAPVDGSLRQT